MEALLNVILRRAMRSVLRFDDVPMPENILPVSGNVRNASLVYVHIPFCESLCPYCSFHRYVYDAKRAHAYFNALLTELELYQRLGCSFTAMYIGGGTPTIALERLLEIIAYARSLFPLREISVETNPNHVQEHILAQLHNAGVNRLSVGVQSFNDDLLGVLGRLEKYGASSAVQQRIRQASGIFDTLNIDLLFNLPLQTAHHLLHDLRVIETLLPDQVTFYPLMVPPSVAMTLKKVFGPIDYRKEKSFYTTILNHLCHHYTGSTAWCFSRHQAMIDEYIIEHTCYAGVGSGAFGCHGDTITINTFSLEEYQQRLHNGLLPITRVKTFSAREARWYLLLMKLFGLSLRNDELKVLRSRYGRAAFAPELFFLQRLGAVRRAYDGYELTDRGRYYWVMAMREFFIAVDTLRDVCRAGVG
ncbi:MAG: coproporphyrinogen III oxidase family protein [Desulfobacterota bacterium]|nr:coproporphyrinogen III oxidase family protein [Thermodesulfobacteriota bacterium]